MPQCAPSTATAVFQFESSKSRASQSPDYAEAALLSVVRGAPRRLSAWHATHASLPHTVLLDSDKPADVERAFP